MLGVFRQSRIENISQAQYCMNEPKVLISINPPERSVIIGVCPVGEVWIQCRDCGEQFYSFELATDKKSRNPTRPIILKCNKREREMTTNIQVRG